MHPIRVFMCMNPITQYSIWNIHSRHHCHTTCAAEDLSSAAAGLNVAQQAPATAELHGNTKLVDVVLCCVAWDTIHHEHGREVGASRIVMKWGKRVWEDQPSMVAGGLAPDSITGYFCSNLKKQCMML